MKPLCEQCSFFKYEDAAGYGYCNIKYREQRCSDRCELTRENLTTKRQSEYYTHTKSGDAGTKAPCHTPM